ncbi:MAG: HNH endonuclease [Candidatus Enteromonas sp.]
MHPIVVILILTVLLSALFLLVSLLRGRSAGFVTKHSLALRRLEEIKGRYAFLPISDIHVTRSYDNEDFYGDINPEDVLVYELKTRLEEIKKSCEDSETNKHRYESLQAEIKESITSFQEFDIPMSEKQRRRSSSVAEDVFRRFLPKPPIPFCVHVRMTLTNYSGRPRAFKEDTFSAEEAMALVRRFRKKKGTYYLDEGIYQSLQRVERGRVTNRVRFKIFARDGNQCCFCGSRENLEIDHVVPISKGGTSDERNLQTLCRDCNRKKGNRIE